MVILFSARLVANRFDSNVCVGPSEIKIPLTLTRRTDKSQLLKPMSKVQPVTVSVSTLLNLPPIGLINFRNNSTTRISATIEMPGCWLKSLCLDDLPLRGSNRLAFFDLLFLIG